MKNIFNFLVIFVLGCGEIVLAQEDCIKYPNTCIEIKNESCVVICEKDFEDCNGVLEDGCETNLLEDPENCGLCGKVCFSPNGHDYCSMGECQE